MGNERMFRRYVGIDYSGAATPTQKLDGLVVYRANGAARPRRVERHEGLGVRWDRKKLAEWLVDRLKERVTTLVGIDHAFSFPIDYFNHYNNIANANWDRFLDDFHKCWQTDRDDVAVRCRYYEQIERLMKGEPGDCRFGRGDWFRLTDPSKAKVEAKVEDKIEAKSVFNFLTKQGDVAHSTHAGLPWLRYIRRELRKAGVKVHFWPFDGWTVGEDRSVVVEVYPALYHPSFAKETKGWNNTHYRDAYSIARWMSVEDGKCQLRTHFKPNLNAKGRARAKKEGWILGVDKPRFPEYGREADKRTYEGSTYSVG